MHVYKHMLVLCGTALMLACAARQGPEAGGEKGGVANDPQAAPVGETGETGEATEANVTPEMIGLGENIFKGKEAGGTCNTCHGDDATGTPTGPNLTDNEWIQIDGSMSSIAKIIREGVTSPKQHQGPMPAFQSQFNDEQVQALAAYVYSLSHPGMSGQQQQQPPQGQEQEPQEPQQPQ
jgi:mono/diheme cytochrome c family protein